MKKKMGFILAFLLVCFIAFPVYAAKGNLGYVNRQKVLSNYPGIQEVMKTLDTQRQEAQKEYNERVKNLPTQLRERAKINDEIAMKVALQEDELMNPIGEKINQTIIKVAKNNKIENVIDAAVMLYGGTDLTDLVIAELKK